MDGQRFDLLVRLLHQAGSRRRALGFVIGGIVAPLFGLVGLDAKKKKHKHKKKKTCKGATKKCGKKCIPKTQCCGGCGEDALTLCLANGSCATICTVFGTECPPECACGNPSTEGPRHCIRADVISCDQFPRACSSIFGCPSGQQCQGVACGAGGIDVNRCVPLCPV